MNNENSVTAFSYTHDVATSTAKKASLPVTGLET